MTILFDGDIDHQGGSGLTGSHIAYIGIAVLSVDPGKASAPNLANPDELQGFGYIQTGDTITVDDITTIYWHQKIWIYEQHMLWTPSPSTGESGGALALVASQVRWNIYGSSTAHMLIYGA